MKQEGPVIEDREVVDMRLLALLRELARDHGRKKAAAVLGVDRRTLEAGLDDGVLSRRMRGALDRALLSGAGSAAAEQRERNERLDERLAEVEGAVDELGKEARRRLAAIERDIGALRQTGNPGRESSEGAAAGTTGVGTDSPPRARLRREYPDLVTREPAEDDEENFGDVWPLIVEWRKLKDAHPNDGKGLDWLRTEERLLTVELALLLEHGMTLPPARFPLRGFDRDGQTSWRRSALYDTRRARKKRELLWRVLTLGLWRP